MIQPEDTPDIDWNELILVSRHQEKVQVWTAWKRALSAFADPGLWESTDNWSKHFKAQEAKGYGMSGYGLVVMDLDTRQGWSINDYTSPGSIYLPHDYQLSEKDETGFLGAMRELLGRPDQWDSVKFQVNPDPGASELREFSLSDIADPNDSVEENLGKLAQVRGEIKIQDQKRMVFSGKYIPQDWRVSDTRERHDLDVLEECLAVISTLGYPPPSEALIMSLVEEKAPDMEDEGEEVFAHDIVARFRGLLDGWGAKPPSRGAKP